MISLIRVDDRLIHGQVMAVWVRTLGVTHILVIDDVTSTDPFSQQVMQLAMPPRMTLIIRSIDAAAEQLSRAAGDTSRTLVLLRSVDSAARLHSQFAYPELNIGGAGMAEGRQLVWRSIALSAAEMRQLKALHDAGVNVYLQMIPTDQRHPLAGL